MQKLSSQPLRIDIWHNILWSAYKAEVFSSLHNIAGENNCDIRFFQMAETEGNRAGLSSVDLSRHRYPYKLLFKGSLDKIGFPARLKAVLSNAWKTDAGLSVLTGYEKPECWAQIALLKLRGRKVALFCDSTIYDQKQGFLKGLAKAAIFKCADGIFGYGKRSREYALRYGATPAKIFHRCQAAALPSNYAPQRALEQRLASASASPRYLYVGRLAPEKDLSTLLDAFSEVFRQRADAELIMVGNGTLLESLRQQAARLGLQDRVKFLGSKSGESLFEEYAKATALVLPSLSEPWGLVVNEALSYGCPVIVSERCGCAPELAQDGKTGFTHAASNAADLAEKMLTAISCFADKEKTARQCIDTMADYTPDKAAIKILEGCCSILGNDSQHGVQAQWIAPAKEQKNAENY